ncbi:hypothetical protein K4039_15025 [Lyngbya sp. CCAP 1446/10]|uniref:hypothetical protein n=1 Tax=Lyngbya sp. CCAP 1446/10 TaxID=439293 RepID=UPI002237716C|nr:hypothetical protein [Lyngbya sp. CCAP 1446/10]MCW6051365.1 hypothetical protein [Lyngbya sp. CCAP 1446/10]
MLAAASKAECKKVDIVRMLLENGLKDVEVWAIATVATDRFLIINSLQSDG